MRPFSPAPQPARPRFANANVCRPVAPVTGVHVRPSSVDWSAPCGPTAISVGDDSPGRYATTDRNPENPSPLVHVRPPSSSWRRCPRPRPPSDSRRRRRCRVGRRGTRSRRCRLSIRWPPASLPRTRCVRRQSIAGRVTPMCRSNVIATEDRDVRAAGGEGALVLERGRQACGRHARPGAPAVRRSAGSRAGRRPNR